MNRLMQGDRCDRCASTATVHVDTRQGFLNLCEPCARERLWLLPKPSQAERNHVAQRRYVAAYILHQSGNPYTVIAHHYGIARTNAQRLAGTGEERLFGYWGCKR